jgi:aminoglycoside phosphotransferase
MVGFGMNQGLFAFIESTHPFARNVERFRAAVQAELRCVDLLDQTTSGEAAVQAEIKGVPTPDGGWVLDRFYWSLQTQASRQPTGFTALTLVYAAEGDRLDWYVFPDDPYLPGLSRSLQENANEILRYVPLRRLTLRTAEAGSDAPMVAKFKRRSRLAESYQRLAVVARAAEHAASSFGVAAPRGLDCERGVFFQSVQPGTDLTLVLDESNMERHFTRLGSVHRELHELSIPDLSAQAVDPIAELRRNTRWITFFRPDCRDLLEATWELARRHAPTPGLAELAVCHGDFVCSQVLVDGDHWTVTDFDACHRGDPYRDMAIFMASLSHDVPLFSAPSLTAGLLESVIQSYLTGYETRAGHQLDAARLLWHRLAAEVYYLALMFKKDWYEPTRFGRGLERVGSLAVSLAEQSKETI